MIVNNYLILSMKMFKALSIAIFVTFTFATAWAYGPPTYLPDAPHPRIWLTPATISDLKAKKAANTLDWQALLKRCDLVIANYPAIKSGGNYQANFGELSWPQGSGYAGSGYLEVLGNLGDGPYHWGRG